LHDTDRSPRRFSVLSALTCPALDMPTSIPYCCSAPGSERVGSILPYSIGNPLYSLKSGRMLETATVSFGNFSGAPARTGPRPAFTGAPSLVTSLVQIPLYARARSTYDCTMFLQVVAPL
jgi:hypothetical protein